ncbi:hypothetical protein [Streptomyces sp. NPDC051577]|uniref:hypothetical protein n=1 Tax=Streptomyces sp. NPDC051577 TaxID=3155166 RepID=UPI00342FD21D
MTSTPYTDTDLRAEAARQHAELLAGPDYAGIGEQMQGQEVTPNGGVDWDDFSDETFGKAQRAVHDLITRAADLSEWAVNIGADGLEPAISDSVSLKVGDRTLVRVHVAFERGLPDDLRQAFIQSLGEDIAGLF